jgi:hypothetical protein
MTDEYICIYIYIYMYNDPQLGDCLLVVVVVVFWRGLNLLFSLPLFARFFFFFAYTSPPRKEGDRGRGREGEGEGKRESEVFSLL